MTGRAAVSVVIVSRNRPAALRRCLIGVSQLIHDRFEVVVVADRDSCASLRALPQAAAAKLVVFDTPNISAARNRGIAEAAGEIIAFIDDDAVPEPTWLHYLCAPFADPAVAAATGHVRGRNGISFQWRGRWVDGTGRDHPLDLPDGCATVLTARPGRAIRTEGTNMAFRRAVLARLGGFDPAYRFFLDETDLNMRLAQIGAATAVVPLAQVHHGFAASDRRQADRAPRDLHEIGASWAVFLSRHCPPELAARTWARIEAAERRRALAHMLRGSLEPGEVRRLMATLAAGHAEGLARDKTLPPPLPAGPAAAFAPYPARPAAASVVISGRIWERRRLRARAREAAAAGNRVTLILLSPSALYHRVRFDDAGYWEQTGGLFGRSDRAQPLFRWWRFRNRVAAECARVAAFRALPQF